ncbi:dTDP-4-dehydrorhamnose reductase [Acetobacter sacchari]|uniref:dTDP-4-dehydrorhamnose reductase n=1 Tax=Acetobacter sacchari TaxID=2661687 RepID=A0ABS3LS44_9PROT|nr:dTDP-4-dehydrorhamnose reductase [Acetobacter sacchari]MBO1358737.1 dTDP-4-dehydrorhamnose reductase [Acetobacter sacchari]
MSIVMDPSRPILVTGGVGQLATSLSNLGGHRVHRVGRPDFDFERPETIEATLDVVKPAAVVNAAAWTAVDLAETEVSGAEAANRDGPALLAAACAARGLPFIHVSTDYVFSGDKGSPYLETDPVSPATVYGRTKAEGEELVMQADPQAIILRTSWVYSAHGKNFVRTMINAGAKNPALKVVGDQRGNPTSSDDLAAAILQILTLIERDGWRDDYAGVYHACGTGEATWHQLAVFALQEASSHGQAMPEVAAIATSDWPTPAKRPADSRMDNSKLVSVFGVSMPDWRASVSEVVTTLFSRPTG